MTNEQEIRQRLANALEDYANELRGEPFRTGRVWIEHCQGVEDAAAKVADPAFAADGSKAEPRPGDDESKAPGIPEELIRYLEVRDRYHAERVVTAVRTLTRFERRILWEAAVMGYVHGHRAGMLDHANGKTFLDKATYPGDANVVTGVIDACGAMDDLYPYLAAACGGRRRRITRTRLWAGEKDGQLR